MAFVKPNKPRGLKSAPAWTPAPDQSRPARARRRDATRAAPARQPTMPPPEPAVDGEALRSPLLDAARAADAEGEADAARQAVGEMTPPSGAWLRNLVAVASVVGAAFTVYLAIEFPVTKHEFQSLNCVPHAELVSLEAAAATALYADGFPVVWQTACGAAADCDGARAAAIAAVDAFCNSTNPACEPLTLAAEIGANPLDAAKLLEKANNTAPAAALDDALAAYCKGHATDSLCLPGGGLATPTTDAAFAARADRAASNHPWRCCGFRDDVVEHANAAKSDRRRALREFGRRPQVREGRGLRRRHRLLPRPAPVLQQLHLQTRGHVRVAADARDRRRVERDRVLRDGPARQARRLRAGGQRSH